MLPESSYEPDDPIVLNTRGQEGKDKGSTESDGLAVGVGAEHGIGRQCGGGRVRYHIREWDDGFLAGGIIGLESSHLSSPPSSQLLGLLSLRPLVARVDVVLIDLFVAGAFIRVRASSFLPIDEL